MTPYPLSDRQLENLRAVFGRGVKKRNGRRLAGNPADFVNTLAGEFGVSAYGMVKMFYSALAKLGTLCFFPPWPKYAEIFCERWPKYTHYAFLWFGRNRIYRLFYGFKKRFKI